VEKDLFADALGRRHRATDPDGSAVEVFRLCPELSAAATTESALTPRAARLSAFVHPGFATIRRVERVPGTTDQFRIISTAVPGIRLSDLLRLGKERGVAPEPGAVRNLARQIAHAMADFHRAFPDLAHGALAPERVIVCPDGRAVIVEHLLAPVLDPLRMGRAAVWTAFQIPVPFGAGAARFDQVTDVVQLGMLTLALVLGRPIEREEYPHEVERLLGDTSAPADSRRPAMSPAMRAWLQRCFQIQLRSAFRTAVEAAAAFEEVVDDEPRHRSLVKAVVAYLEAVEPGSTRSAANSASGPGSSGAPGGSGGGRVSPVHPLITSPGSLRSAPAAAGDRPATGSSIPVAGRSTWAEIRRRVAIAAGSLGLLVMLGVIYLGLHSYASRSINRVGHHALTTESQPAAPGAKTGHAWPPKPPASSTPAVLPAAGHPL
jgi:hypothetical protein